MADFQVIGQIVIDDSGTASIRSLNDSLAGTSESSEQAGVSFTAFADKALEVYAQVQAIANSLNQAYGMIDSTNQMGVTALRAGENLRNMGLNIDGLSQAAGGLVDSATLAQTAVLDFSTGVASTQPQLENIIHLGAELGEQYMGNAAAGVDALSTSLEHVGATRSLYQLGVDAKEVAQNFKDLVASGMGSEDAWHTAVLDAVQQKVEGIGDSLTKTGTSWEHLKTQVSDFATQGAENVATGIEAIIAGIENIGRAAGARVEMLSLQITGTLNDLSYQATTTLDGVALNIDKVLNPGNVATDMNAIAGAVSAHIREQADLNTQINTTQKVLDAYVNSGGNTNAMLLALSSNTQQATAAQKGMVTGANDAKTATDSLTASVQASGTTATATAKNYQTLQEAFGTGKGGIGGSFTSEFQKNLDEQQKALDKSFGPNSQKAIEFSKQAAQAMDNYKIATGEATPESEKFDSMVAEVNARLASGTTSASQAAAQLEQLATAAQHGQTSMGDLAKINNELFGATNEMGAAMEHAGEYMPGGAKAPTTTAASQGQGWAEMRQAVADTGTAATAATPAVNDFVAGLGNMTTKAQGAADALISNLASAFPKAKNAADTSAAGFSATGGNIVTGMVAGLNDKAGALYDAVTNVVKQALATANSAAQAQSPSRLFMQVGKNIVDGLTLGIQNGAALPGMALRGAVSNAYSTTNNVTNQRTTNVFMGGMALYKPDNTSNMLSQSFRKT